MTGRMMRIWLTGGVDNVITAAAGILLIVAGCITGVTYILVTSLTAARLIALLIAAACMGTENVHWRSEVMNWMNNHWRQSVHSTGAGRTYR
jgi:hypothetical protein